MGCTFTAPTCPGLVRATGAPACSLYDEGTVQGCEDYYAKFSSCEDIQYKRCVVVAIPNSAPAGCDDIEDAGADVLQEASVEDGSVDEDAADGAADSSLEDVQEGGMQDASDAQGDGSSHDAWTDSTAVDASDDGN